MNGYATGDILAHVAGNGLVLLMMVAEPAPEGSKYVKVVLASTIDITPRYVMASDIIRVTSAANLRRVATRKHANAKGGKQCQTD